MNSIIAEHLANLALWVTTETSTTWDRDLWAHATSVRATTTIVPVTTITNQPALSVNAVKDSAGDNASIIVILNFVD